jgi:protein-S-isoprenylcysteine O-methyltransferase Ste14
MSLQNIAILFLFAALGFVFFGVVYKVKASGGELFGQPTINLSVQLLGKILILLPNCFLLFESLGFNLSWLEVPDFLRWIGIFIFFEGVLFLCFSLIHLGRYTKMGLPKNDVIQLRTTGIYKLSRNPMYLGLIIVAIASVMMVPNPFNLVFAVAGILIHHKIIINEEKFLTERFEQQYLDYKQSTNRYL